MGRRPKGWAKWLIPTIAVSWSLFQLSIASWLIVDSTFTRAIHLGFALLIVYLNYPLFKRPKFGIDYFSATNRIPILDMVISVIAAVSALYIALDYDGLILRYGRADSAGPGHGRRPGDPVAGSHAAGHRSRIAVDRHPVLCLRLPGTPHARPDRLQGGFPEPFHGADDHVHRGDLRHPLGCVGDDRLSFRALRRHAGQGRGRTLFHPTGPEPFGRVQGRAGQGGGPGQRAHRPGVRLQHRQYRHHRNIHHSLDEESGLPPHQGGRRGSRRQHRRPTGAADHGGRGPSLSPNMSTCPMWT